MAKSTISTIKKKEEIKSVKVTKGISKLSSSRCNSMEQMATFLLLWINKKLMAGETKEFFGTKRWFTGFRKRNGLQCCEAW